MINTNITIKKLNLKVNLSNASNVACNLKIRRDSKYILRRLILEEGKGRKRQEFSGFHYRTMPQNWRSRIRINFN
jgi:hypothetical protein